MVQWYNLSTTLQQYIESGKGGGGGMPPTVGFLSTEMVLQRLRSIRGQDNAAETGRRATPQATVVRNRSLK